jgi:hypothetical protein
MHQQPAGGRGRVVDAAQAEQMLGLLLLDRNARNGTSVNHHNLRPTQLGRPQAPKQRQGLKIVPVLRQEFAEVDVSSFRPVDLASLVAMRQCEGIVIAKHRQQTILTGKLNYRLRIRALGYQIARQYDAVAAAVPALAQQHLQLLNTTVDVSDDDSPLHRIRAS